MKYLVPLLFLRFLCAHMVDVVIPCIEKDLLTLDACIEGIQKHGHDVRRVIVVSDTQFTENAEWFDEKLYPFQKEDIAEALYGIRDRNLPRVGWIYQQLLKLYAPFVIPDIAEYVLVLDADTLFLRPVTFVEDDGTVNYNVGTEYVPEYFTHMQQLHPSFRKVFPQFSGICHHMVFHKPVLQALMEEVEAFHRRPFLDVVLAPLDAEHLFFSEYELYFNYVFAREYPVRIRGLRWANISLMRRVQKYARLNFEYVSIHEWMRELVQ